MTVVAWDTETTGLPLYDRRSSDPGQPHIVQLAMVQYGEDGTELSTRSVIVKPDGWEIPPEMTAIHGISQERALAEGIPEAQAVALWLVAMARATMSVAHNHPFDARIARIGMARAGYQKDLADFMKSRPSFCTQSKSRTIIDLPPTDKMLATGRKTAKAPSLAEAVRHFFGEEIVGAHDGLVDARWAGRIFWHLRGMGVT